MGTCVSKCYTAGSGSTAATPLPPAAASCNVVAVHPLPINSSSSSSSSSFKAMVTSSSSSFKAMATSSSSSSFKAFAMALKEEEERDSLSVEWDVVVLDPNNKKPPPPTMRPHQHHLGRSSPATSKRARPVSPLATRPAPSSHHKKKKMAVVVRPTEPHAADAQARKKKVEAPEQRRLHRVPPPQVRSSRAGAPEDELTNPLISMDCFIFL